MKKLLIATDNYLPRWDGISRFLSEIIPRLEKDYEITIIAPDFGTTKKEKHEIIKIPLSNIVFGDFPIPKLKYDIIKKEINKADIVFTQTIGPIGILSIIAAKKKSKPLTAFIHSIEWELVPKAANIPIIKKALYPLTKKITKIIYNKPDKLIVPSNNIADMLSWEGIRTKKKIVHLGVDTKKFKKENKEKAKKKIGLTKEDLVIGYHGRLGREKDLKTLMRAFTRIRTTYENAKLLIVGTGVEDVEKIFRGQKNVIIAGQQNNVIPWIQAMDIYVLPSLTETSSLTTLEAMSCEVPVIATSVGFVKDYVEDEINGLFFRKKDSFELSKKIELLIQQPELRKKLGEKARQTVIEKFNWDITGEKIEKAINEMINKE